MVDPGDHYTADQKPVIRVDDFKRIYLETVGNTADLVSKSNFSEVESTESL